MVSFLVGNLGVGQGYGEGYALPDVNGFMRF